MPKAFTEYEKEIIRKRLLEQGNKQFSTYGLKKTNIDELATAVGISKGAFYLFYPSKEALYLDIAEQAEQHFRREVLAAIDRPGLSAHARLQSVLKEIFALLKTIPLFQYLSQGDYDLLFRRIPEAQLNQHLVNDRNFMAELITRCQQAGIPIQVSLQHFSSLIFSLLVVSLYSDNLLPGYSEGAFDLLLELTIAYCLGEIPVQSFNLPEPLTFQE